MRRKMRCCIFVSTIQFHIFCTFFIKESTYNAFSNHLFHRPIRTRLCTEYMFQSSIILKYKLLILCYCTPFISKVYIYIYFMRILMHNQLNTKRYCLYIIWLVFLSTHAHIKFEINIESKYINVSGGIWKLKSYTKVWYCTYFQCLYK